MRRANKILLTMGSAMLISSGTAMAAPPMAYGQFDASTGTISSTGVGGCPAAATSCGAPITGNGFFQRSVVIGGNTYFQTIVLPTNANVTGGVVSGLAFADENFVKQGGGTGIADNQHLFAVGTTSNPGDFTGDTAINAGWAQGTGAVISLSQSLVDGTAFDLGFSLTGNGTAATGLTVTQNVALGGTDKQEFDLRQVTKTAVGSSAALPAGPTSGSITWVAGNIIQAVWMGQAITTGTGQQQMSGFQGYSNVTSGTAVSYTDQTTTGPWSYDTASFGGAAPTF